LVWRSEEQSSLNDECKKERRKTARGVPEHNHKEANDFAPKEQDENHNRAERYEIERCEDGVNEMGGGERHGGDVR
jgi:hypothetical protein